MSRNESMIETLRQLVEAEEQSEGLTRLSNDIYSDVSLYIQKLRKSVDIDAEDPLSRLTKRQLSLMIGITDRLLSRRLSKAMEENSTRDLLPEERHVFELHAEFERAKSEFLGAIASGRPSIFSTIRKAQMEKMVMVRFLKPLGEVVGFDLHHYGPFKAHDVARIPTGNAEVMISNGDAVLIRTEF